MGRLTNQALGASLTKGQASVRFARAITPKSANSPRTSLGNAAAAIIAALSVASAGDGKCAGHGSPAERAAARKPLLEATPPAIISERAPIRPAESPARVSSSRITA